MHSGAGYVGLGDILELVFSGGLNGRRLVLVIARIDACAFSVLLEQDEFLRQIWRHGCRDSGYHWSLSLHCLLWTPAVELHHRTVLLQMHNFVHVGDTWTPACFDLASTYPTLTVHAGHVRRC